MEFLSSGKKVRVLRKKLNIKQQDLDKLGVSRCFISMVENGKRKLPERLLQKLVPFFNEKAAELGIGLNVTEEYLRMSDKEEAEIYCTGKLQGDLDLESVDELILISAKYSLEGISAKTNMLKGDMLFDRKRYEEAFTYYYEALYIYNKIENRREEAFTYNKLGKCKFFTLNYLEAITYFKKTNALAGENHDEELEIKSFYNLALSYRRLDKIQDSLEYIDKYIDLCKKKEDLDKELCGEILRADCFTISGEIEKAVDTFNNIISSIEDPMHSLLGYVYTNIAGIYLNIGDFQKSLDYYNKSYSIREVSDRENLSHVIICKAKVYVKLGLNDKAVESINRGIELARQHRDYEFMMKGYGMLEEIYTSLNKDAELEKTYVSMLDILEGKDKTDELLKLYVKMANFYMKHEDLKNENRYIGKLKDYYKDYEVKSNISC